MKKTEVMNDGVSVMIAIMNLVSIKFAVQQKVTLPRAFSNWLTRSRCGLLLTAFGKDGDLFRKNVQHPLVMQPLIPPPRPQQHQVMTPELSWARVYLRPLHPSERSQIYRYIGTCLFQSFTLCCIKSFCICIVSLIHIQRAPSVQILLSYRRPHQKPAEGAKFSTGHLAKVMSSRPNGATWQSGVQ